MAHSAKFTKHVFISYAHIDNQPLTPEQKGWVSRFHASLEAMLATRMGRQPKIWRDQKLSGNDVFADEILAQFPETALLISVLTPRYVDSDWCTREVREFCKIAHQAQGVVVGNKSRVIKVIKTPVDSEGALSQITKGSLGYEFFIVDEQQTPFELDPAYGPDLAYKYNLKLAKLAWDISQQIRSLEAAVPDEQAAEQAAGQPAPQRSIYLAECSWDQREAREALEAELRVHGYSILPDRQLPRDEDSYVVEVKRLLDQCELSIHLVGSMYGAVPDGPTQKSIVELQNEIAAARSRSAGLRRVIWLREGTSSQHPDQQQFIGLLHESADAQFGADLLTGDFETLKGAVHTMLAPAGAPAPVEDATPDDGTKRVYLICDERDRKATIPLRRFLKARGLDVQLPVFQGAAAVVRRENQELMRLCNAAIVFYGAGDEAWKRSVDSELRKARSYRAAQPDVPIYTYLAEPATDHKTDLIDVGEANLINGLGAVSDADLEPLMKPLQEAVDR
jgi:hypothetical protein